MIRLEDALRLKLPPALAGCMCRPDGESRILAVGAELKSTICMCGGEEAAVSRPFGDLTEPTAYRHFVATIEGIASGGAFVPDLVAHDLHPLYLSTQYARRMGKPTIAVQHHHAHALSLMGEWGEIGPLVGIVCDGTGYGADGAAWGCEILLCERGDFERVGALEYFPLVGGDKAAIETWRPAAALLRQAFGERWREFMPRDAPVESTPVENRRHGQTRVGSRCHGRVGVAELDLFERQVARGLNTPLTSSLGRVFDAVSFMLGLCARNNKEAEAAIALEAAAASGLHEPYEYGLGVREGISAADGARKDSRTSGRFRTSDGFVRMSIAPTVAAIVGEVRAGEDVGRIAARFHETLARMLSEAALTACEERGVATVGLSGGCFNNGRLRTRMVELLEGRGLRVLCHQRVTCGDAGISLGQALAAAWKLSSQGA